MKMFDLIVMAISKPPYHSSIPSIKTISKIVHLFVNKLSNVFKSAQDLI